MNTWRKLFVSVEISKDEAKRIHSTDDLVSLMLEDCSPLVSDDFKGELAKQHADNALNDALNVEITSHHGVSYIHVAQSLLENFESDEDGDFLFGSDYEPTAEFTPEQLQTIREFCGF